MDKADEKMNTGKDNSSVWKKSRFGIDIGNADRRQVADTGIRISEFHKFMTCSFSGRERRKYSYDRRIFTMYSVLPAILHQAWTDLIRNYWIRSHLRIGF